MKRAAAFDQSEFPSKLMLTGNIKL